MLINFLATLGRGKTLSACENLGISVTIAPIVGPSRSQYYSWTVSTMPANDTEKQIQESFMNETPDKTNFTFLSNQLIAGYTYTFQADTYNDHRIFGKTYSINITVTDCLPPDFDIIGKINLLIS